LKTKKLEATTAVLFAAAVAMTVPSDVVASSKKPKLDCIESKNLQDAVAEARAVILQEALAGNADYFMSNGAPWAVYRVSGPDGKNYAAMLTKDRTSDGDAYRLIFNFENTKNGYTSTFTDNGVDGIKLEQGDSIIATNYEYSKNLNQRLSHKQVDRAYMENLNNFLKIHSLQKGSCQGHSVRQ
jgi:hypothetical protein